MSIISGSSVTGADVPTPIDPRDYFNTVLYTGNGTAYSSGGNAITGVGFQPDFVWIKARNVAYNNYAFDVLRGVQKRLNTDATNAEAIQTETLNVFGSDGFTLGNDAGVNESAKTYVAWNWKANGAGSTNTAGTITSTVSVNTTSGFSIVTYSITSASATISTFGHGLGIAPSMVILKVRNAVDEWTVYHNAISNPNSNWLTLNTTNAAGGATSTFSSSSTTFGVRETRLVGSGLSGNILAYCFAEIADFSKIGSYTGNGSATGPSVTTGFQPTWLMIKRTDSTGDWIIHDSARDATNPRTAFLDANTTDTEGSGLDVDFNSTGFQIKSSSATVNANGGTYIYMCIA